MGAEYPASESLESPKAENEITWKKTTDQTGAAYSGKNTFKSGEGEFTVVHQGDSFSKAHSYLLLTDVPGASANSGATITSKDSNGKQAFVATETRGTTEQEVAVGAGSELKTLIDNSGKSDFLQLVGTLAKRKINFGSATMTYNTETFYNAKTVTHSLGATPVVVLVTSSNEFVNCASLNFGATTFQINAATTNGAAGPASLPVSWVAIG